ncbi:cobalt ECF transporter T component CbiQ [Archaeoglobus neptunius]|uniref:cobalt ECF transporter T component CbiQ n=1 Tax=Archaeoglobus neptunius TaxID=2798580 RepID=UPI0019294046|nr:cobalt ECF transporter T component CbiQ [Archaeoglobus neptunius]
MHELLERTIREASGYFQNFLIHEYTKRSILHKIDPRIKLVSTIVFILLAVSTFDLEKVILTFVFLLVISAISGLSLRKVLGRIWLFTLFSFIVVLPVSINNPLYSITFTLRVAASLIAIQMLIMTTNFAEICSALRYFKVPETFVSALWLAYRYAILMFRELLSILLARESRRVSKGSHMDVWRKGGEAVGLFFLRSFEKAERIQLALEARGENRVSYSRKFKTLDLIYTIIVAFTVLWWVVI